MKKFTALLLALIIMTSVIPAQAACSTPACVKKAAEKAMNESGMDIAFIVKVDKTGKGTGYMMYREKGKVHCDRSGQVILGKNTKICKKYHYYFHRNRDAEKKLQTFGTYRWRYTSYDRMTNEQFLYMRAKQVRWVAPNVMSCLLLSLYRRCGFGGDKRLPRVAAQIAEVREEFGNSEEALRAACLEETGISIVDYMDTHEVEVSEE